MILRRAGLILALLVVAIAVVTQWSSIFGVDKEAFYKEKRVILTGATRGIGKELAIQLAQLGARLVIAGRTADQLQETADLCLRHTPDVYAVVADVSLERDCRTVVDTAVQKLGGLDILILNAAISPTPQWFWKYDAPGEKFSEVLGTNLLQSVYLVYLSLPYLNASQGHIIPVSSGSGVVGIPKVSAYGTSKHALHGFFKGLRQEFILTNTPISITIMPLPYILTEIAVKNWEPIGTGGGMEVKECASRMLQGIPSKKAWYYIDWEIYIIAHIYSLCPTCFDMFARLHLRLTSNVFAGI